MRRPGVHEFLERANELFELSIFTKGSRSYALCIASILGKRSIGSAL